MIRFFALFFLFTITVKAQDQFVITGRLEGFEDNSIVLIKSQNIAIDSSKLVDNKFILKGSIQEIPNFVNLIVKNDKYAKSVTLYIGNEKVLINAKIDDFPYDVKTKGSVYDNERYKFAQIEKPFLIERNRLLSKMWELRDEKKWNDSLQKVYWSKEEPKGIIVKIDDELAINRNKFIEENINTYYGLSLLDTYKTEFENTKIKLLLSKLNPKMSKTVYVKSINSHLYNPELKIGEKYYDFTALNSNNKQINFSSYFNNKFILLDFSTIYCGWCLQAIPMLEKIQDENNGKLDIITFYVDKNINGFEILEKKHSKNWKILWDKEGRLSDTYAKYKVYATPTFYLFSPEGKLVKIYNGYSENMEREIEKLIN